MPAMVRGRVSINYGQLSDVQLASPGWIVVQLVARASWHSLELPAAPWTGSPLPSTQRVPFGKIVPSGRLRSWQPVPMPLLKLSIAVMQAATVIADEVPWQTALQVAQSMTFVPEQVAPAPLMMQLRAADRS